MHFFTQMDFNVIYYGYKVRKRKEVTKMKEKLFVVIKKVIMGVAVFSSNTTSVTGLYQPKTPESLLKSDKKKVQ